VPKVDICSLRSEGHCREEDFGSNVANVFEQTPVQMIKSWVSMGPA
jgi:hypothetical protein